MKTNYLLTAIACGSMLLTANYASAQETVVVEQETITLVNEVQCKTHYSSSWRDNWFIQLGAGVQTPFTEFYLPDGKQKREVSMVYNLGFGHWFSPYLGFRISGMYGKMRYDFDMKNKAQMATANADLMWDMTSSVCGVNPKRVFSFIPFVGIGGTYTWDFKGIGSNVVDSDGKYRGNQWTLPVSAGFQMRFRLCDYVDFFAEARAQFYGDQFNGYVGGDPIEANITAIGGFNINIGPRKFEAYNPCDYLSYINDLNGKVNDLRGELAATTAALAAAEAQLPCPEVTQAQATAPGATPMLAVVRFKINSAYISNEEMVNVYNVAQWMKANPDATVSVEGYADRDTGTAEYNQELSERRAKAVIDALVNDYGINADRLKANAYGSSTQPYPENNWNRIVIFTQP
ncbi:MAG: OmpA family protein [Firmicutes bacterium]|nr:OmpA family protein [Bacillota bacterium]MCM1401262.1 OmpA family protein [Bacteroides sp.]MCM1477189.1 OmpA family protein [Bacteroides sp.]